MKFQGRACGARDSPLPVIIGVRGRRCQGTGLALQSCWRVERTRFWEASLDALSHCLGTREEAELPSAVQRKAGVWGPAWAGGGGWRPPRNLQDPRRLLLTECSGSPRRAPCTPAEAGDHCVVNWCKVTSAPCGCVLISVYTEGEAPGAEKGFR